MIFLICKQDGSVRCSFKVREQKNGNIRKPNKDRGTSLTLLVKIVLIFVEIINMRGARYQKYVQVKRNRSGRRRDIGLVFQILAGQ